MVYPFGHRAPRGQPPRVVVGSGDRTPQGPRPSFPLTPYPSPVSLQGRVTVGDGQPTFPAPRMPVLQESPRPVLDPKRVIVGSGDRTQVPPK